MVASKTESIKQQKLWADYFNGRSLQSRNALVECWMPVVAGTAERIWAKLPFGIDLQDLISVGVFGLVSAIEKFDPARGVKFVTYCIPRIRGAIVDELRAMDWVPRLTRRRAAVMNKAREQLVVELGREPDQTELAQRVGALSGAGATEFKMIQADSHPLQIGSHSGRFVKVDHLKDRFIPAVELEDQRQASPLREAQRRELKEIITRGLSRQERLIIILYYFEELSMKEIGATLDLSESRVSQIHSNLLLRLRAKLTNIGLSGE